jgi:hypothetical protein
MARESFNRKRIETIFKRFCDTNGFRIATGWGDVGGFALDYYPGGGGYQIVQITTTGGAQHTPFGVQRYKPSAFADLLWFGEAVGNFRNGRR